MISIVNMRVNESTSHQTWPLSSRLTRRSLLKWGIAASGLVVPNLIGLGGRKAFAQELPPPSSLGRVTLVSLNIRQAPTTQSALVRQLLRDEVIPLYGQTEGEAVETHNNIWFKTADGYVYSSYVQPIENIKNEPEPMEIVQQSFWGEVTVPYTDAYPMPSTAAQPRQRLYYTGVFRIVDATTDERGQWWYRLKEGYAYVPSDWVLASDIRRIHPEELTPISPDVQDKLIRVELASQSLIAYENGTPVLSSRVSSGYGDFFTPVGDHSVIYKWPTARMTGGTGDDYYDLPGVGFPTFLTWTGVAIHTAYWHNDFGVMRSHGCLNVPSAVSRWVWRWTAPTAPYDEAYFTTPEGVAGTRVIVRERFNTGDYVTPM